MAVCYTKTEIMRDTSSPLAFLQDWMWRDVLAFGFTACAAYYVAVGIYRVYFHPLSKFPGPKVWVLCSFPHSALYIEFNPSPASSPNLLV